MKLNINVTQDNIDDAEPSTKCHCPIALAVRDCAVRDHGARRPIDKMNYVEASIDHDKGRLRIIQSEEAGGVTGCFAFSLPKEAQKFIADRDEKLPVAPFAFTTTAKAYAPGSAHS